MFQELSEDNLEIIVADNKTVVVQYAATWCGNCRIMKPKFKKLATENPDAVFNNIVFGELNKYEWYLLERKHLNHHFEQFNLL